MGSRAISTLKSTFILLGIAGICLAIAAALFYKGYLRFNYPSDTEFPVKGIDVSHHQGIIDWSAVKNEGIRFAYIKATEGGDFVDEKFTPNWQQAKAAGIDVGAYHFFTFCRSAKDQARNFIANVPASAMDLPPVIDLEFGGNCKPTLSDTAMLQKIDSLQELLYQHYKQRPVFYVTNDFYQRYLLNQFPDNPLWYRDIYHQPQIADKRHWHFWQYANRGHLNGISTYVDLNVFAGSSEEYEGFKKK